MTEGTALVETGVHCELAARPGVHRRDDLHLCPRRRGPADERRRLFHARLARLDTPARKRRQGTRSALRIQARTLSGRLYRGGGHRGRQGLAALAHDWTIHRHASPHDAAGRLPHDCPAHPEGRHRTRGGNHSLRATGITDYLKSEGTLEHAQVMAAHSSPRTTKLFDRRSDETALDEYQKVRI